MKHFYRLFFAFLAATIPGLGRSSAALEPESVPFVFASSGGVSLGSYQAGVNWGVVRYLKARRGQGSLETRKPDLRAATGASAGSINTLLTAVSWCLDDAPQKSRSREAARLTANELYDNLFFKTWREVGIDELLPFAGALADGEQLDYGETDGLFSRTALSKAFDDIQFVADNGSFRPDCVVPLAFTVTRVKAQKLNQAGVELENSRFLVAMVARTVEGPNGHRMVFQADVTTDDPALSISDPDLGNLIMLPATVNGKYLAPSQVKSALLASSSFPVAFSPTLLEYCEPSAGFRSASGCPQGYRLVSNERFVDGGVFDNIPLGAAKALAEPRQDDVATAEDYGRAARRFAYVYVDPDVLRSDDKVEEDFDLHADPRRNDLQSQLAFLGGAFSSARNYELYNTLRDGDWSQQACALVLRVLEVGGASIGPRQFCEPLFRLWTDPGLDCISATPSRDDPETARACMIDMAVELERQYNLNPFGGANTPANELRLRRGKLAEWMSAALGNLDDAERDLRQLAQTISHLQDDSLGDRRLYLTSRYPRVVGELLWAFGAFLDESFRRYDYYAGVYDALVNLTGAECEPYVGEPQFSDCMAERSEQVYLLLCGNGALCTDPEHRQGNTIIRFLANLEGWSWEWLADLRVDETERMTQRLLALGRALPVALEVQVRQNANFSAACEAAALKSGDVNIRLFKLLACTEAYREPSGEDCDLSVVVCRIVRFSEAHVKRWYIDLIRSATDRLMVLEDRSGYGTLPGERPGEPYAEQAASAAGTSNLIRGGLGAVRWVAESAAVPDNGDGMYLSTADRPTGFNFLPYSVGTDLHDGMGSLSWEPRYYLNTRWSVGARLSPVLKSRNRDRTVRFTQGDLYLSRHFDSLGLSSIGIGPSYSYTWQGRGAFDGGVTGYSAYVGILGDKLRLTYGDRAFDSGFAGEDNYLLLGINDLPGMFYWLFGGNRGLLGERYP
ncbi:MAG: patatin-like phospholipase family protein [Pseudomonadota bacterium]